MAESSRKAERSKIDNALFVLASAQNLPEELTGIASHITVNYPWGSLLHALVEPDVAVLKNIAKLTRPHATLTILLNQSVFEDAEYCQRLGLPLLNETKIRNGFAATGIHIKRWSTLEKDPPHRTTWGQKLTQGTKRKTLLIEAMVR